jgi:hypothetical protein
MIDRQEEAGKKILYRDVAELARFVKGAGVANIRQDTLFGSETTSQSLALEKAQLSSYIRDRLAKERRTFGFVAKGDCAAQLEQSGVGKVDAGAAGDIATQAAQAEELYARESIYSGPISNALNAAAARVAGGEKPGTVQRELYENIRRQLVEIAAAGPAQGGPRAGRDNPAAGREEVDLEEVRRRDRELEIEDPQPAEDPAEVY